MPLEPGPLPVEAWEDPTIEIEQPGLESLAIAEAGELQAIEADLATAALEIPPSQVEELADYLIEPLILPASEINVFAEEPPDADWTDAVVTRLELVEDIPEVYNRIPGEAWEPLPEIYIPPDPNVFTPGPDDEEGAREEAVTPAGPEPEVQLLNLDRAGAADFFAGERWQLIVLGIPTSEVSVTAWHNGELAGTSAYGFTDDTGRFDLSGVMGEEHVGVWIEIWTAGGIVLSPILRFDVLPRSLTELASFLSVSGFTAEEPGVTPPGEPIPPPPGAPEGAIVAPPPGAELGPPAGSLSVSTQGEVVWTTTNVTAAAVLMSINGSPELFFAGGLFGRQAASFALPGNRYEFRLYDWSSGYQGVRLAEAPFELPAVALLLPGARADLSVTREGVVTWSTANIIRAEIWAKIASGAEVFLTEGFSGSKQLFRPEVGRAYEVKLYEAGNALRKAEVTIVTLHVPPDAAPLPPARGTLTASESGLVNWTTENSTDAWIYLVGDRGVEVTWARGLAGTTIVRPDPEAVATPVRLYDWSGLEKGALLAEASIPGGRAGG